MIDDAPDIPFIARNGARRKNHLVAGCKRDHRMIALGQCARWRPGFRLGFRSPIRPPCRAEYAETHPGTKNPGCRRDSRTRGQRRPPVPSRARPSQPCGPQPPQPRQPRESAQHWTRRSLQRPGRMPCTMISRNVLPTSPSEGLMPSRKILVESEMSARTPSAPIAASRFASVGLPMPGSLSIFQSPE